MAGKLILAECTFSALTIATAVTSAELAQTAIPKPVEKLISADRDCRDYNASHLEPARVTARLTENQTLYLLPCFAGA